MTERKCCNCCKFAEAIEHSIPVRRSQKGTRVPEGRVICKCMLAGGATKGPYYDKTFYFTRRPCVFFKQGIWKIYNIDDENFYIEWLRAKMNQIAIRVPIEEGNFTKYNKFYDYEELNSHLQYHKQLRKYPRKPKGSYSKYGKVL